MSDEQGEFRVEDVLAGAEQRLEAGYASEPGLEIKLNNCATNDPCAICGDRTDPIVGPELFLAGTWALVCEDCGWSRNPELMNRLRIEQREVVTDIVALLRKEQRFIRSMGLPLFGVADMGSGQVLYKLVPSTSPDAPIACPRCGRHPDNYVWTPEGGWSCPDEQAKP